MSKTVKKSTCLLLVLTMLFSLLAINASAAEVPEEDYGVMPCWTTIRSVDASLVISGINSTSIVKLYSNVSTSLKIVVNFQKYKSGGFDTLETWTETGTGTYLKLEETRLINIFADYRLRVVCTAGSESDLSLAYP